MGTQFSSSRHCWKQSVVRGFISALVGATGCWRNSTDCVTRRHLFDQQWNQPPGLGDKPATTAVARWFYYQFQEDENKSHRAHFAWNGDFHSTLCRQHYWKKMKAICLVIVYLLKINACKINCCQICITRWRTFILPTFAFLSNNLPIRRWFLRPVVMKATSLTIRLNITKAPGREYTGGRYFLCTCHVLMMMTCCYL